MSQEINQEPSSRSLISLRDAMLAELDRLRGIMRGEDIENSEDYLNLSDEEKEIIKKFLEYFSICPICKEKNHEYYLQKFYFDSAPDKILLKERLLKLIEESKNFEDIYYNKIRVGIPCCKCFSQFFEKKRREVTIHVLRANPRTFRDTSTRRLIMNELRELFQRRMEE